MIHQLAVPELFQHGRDDQNHDDRGCDLADRRNDDARDSLDRKAHIGCHVDANRTGCGLRHSQHIHQIGVCVPAGRLTDIFQEGQGGHAAAHGKQTGLEKFPKQPQIDAHLPFTSRFFRRIPAAAAAITNHVGGIRRKILPSSTKAKIAAVRLSTTDFLSSFITALKISTQTQT